MIASLLSFLKGGLNRLLGQLFSKGCFREVVDQVENQLILSIIFLLTRIFLFIGYWLFFTWTRASMFSFSWLGT